MNKQFLLNITTPCSAKWSNFTPTTNGGFCTSCTREVIDFTKMNDGEIFAFFSNHAGHTCGRFHPDQLKSYTAVPLITARPGIATLKAGVVSLLLLFISKPASAQTVDAKRKTEFVSQRESKKVKSISTITNSTLIRGIVKAEDNLPLPGVNILLKGSEIGTVTDIDGYFEFPQKLNDNDVLLFSFIGYVPIEYKIPKQSPERIEINLTLDMDIMGEVSVGHVYENPRGFGRLWQTIKQLF